MKQNEIQELHYITPITNVPSILKYGIQSNRRAEVGRKKGLIEPASVAMDEVQSLRDKIKVPGGRPLHEYANLYLCARNPMLFKRKEQHDSLCVLRISPKVLDISGAIVTDMNAASGICRFAPAPGGLDLVDAEMVFAEDWTHPNDLSGYWRHKAVKCAEVLVPDQVPARFITGAYVSCEISRDALQAIAANLKVRVNEHLFFQGRRP
jgi:hypothetical protein